jgi:hypothetical protein
MKIEKGEFYAVITGDINNGSSLRLALVKPVSIPRKIK